LAEVIFSSKIPPINIYPFLVIDIFWKFVISYILTLFIYKSVPNVPVLVYPKPNLKSLYDG
jgi:hypothetical protein